MGNNRLHSRFIVVFAHTHPILMFFVGGRNAVQMFYMISGFLISYRFCSTRLAYRNPAVFWVNRALRLYRPYYLSPR